MAGSFSAQVSDWCREELEREQTVLQISAQMVYNQVRVTYNEGGRLPIDNGDLRRSIVASDASMPEIKPEQTSFTDQSATSLEVLGTMRLGTVSFIGVTASYGPRMNYGFVGTDSLGRTYNQTGFGFIDAEEQAWPQTVARAESQVRTRFEAGPSKA